MIFIEYAGRMAAVASIALTMDEVSLFDVLFIGFSCFGPQSFYSWHADHVLSAKVMILP